MSNIIPQITVDEFLAFKTQNIEILLDAQEYIKRVGNTNKINKVNKQQSNNKKTYQKYQNKSSGWKQTKYGQRNYQTDGQQEGSGGNNNARSRPTTYDNEDDLLYTKFRSALNKLSGNNITTITCEIKALPLTKKEHMEKLIEFIFSKAVKETKFTAIYAAFISHMMSHKVKIDDVDVIFAVLFFKKCKAMFDECIAFDVELETQYLESVDTKVSKTFNFKDEVIGCINFVGELYNYRVLNNNVANICLSSIMKSLEVGKAYSIDIMCNFSRTISRRFCTDNKEIFNNHVQKLVKIKDTVNVKEKFIIMDLVDYLNKNNILNIKY